MDGMMNTFRILFVGSTVLFIVVVLVCVIYYSIAEYIIKRDIRRLEKELLDTRVCLLEEELKALKSELKCGARHRGDKK